MIVNDASFSTLAGKILTIDARTMESRIIKVAKRLDCPVCSKKPEHVILSSYSPVCSATLPREISCAAALEMKNAKFIDVRELAEWNAGRIEGAKHLPLSALRSNTALFADLGLSGECILYCQRGARSKQAAQILIAAGYDGLYDLSGGYEGWCKNSG